MFQILEKGQIQAIVDTHGGELRSLKKNGREYLWDANPAYWPRISPVLFPIVGSIVNNQYRHEGRTYEMGGHGFARDSWFKEEEITDTRASYVLEANDETRAMYPFEFRLHNAYEISDDGVKVSWTVENTGNVELPFSIGGHPAFRIHQDAAGTMKGNYIVLDKPGTHEVPDFGHGVVLRETHFMTTDAEGYFALDEHTFDNNVYILAEKDVHSVSLAGSDRKPYVTVKFDSPLVGIWSPPRKNAPFVCIEPWYGRADMADFAGEFKDREYGHILAPGETFRASYRIQI